MNYVTIIYLFNLLVYVIYFFAKSGNEVAITNTDYIISTITSLLLILAGYLNARQKNTYRSVLWMFFVNILFLVMSGLFDEFGNNFNLFSRGNDHFIFTLSLIVFNGYLFPLIVELDKSGLALVVPVLLSFILPSLGYWMEKIIPSKKSDSPEINSK